MPPKKTIVLLNMLPSVGASYRDRGATYPTTAIMLIGSLLKNHGFQVVVVDGAYHDDYLARLRQILTRERQDVVFFGLSAMTTQIPFALEASGLIKKEFPEIPVVWGGPHTTLFPDQVLRDDRVDIIVANEGAVTALKLAERLSNGESIDDIPGIGLIKTNGEPVLNEKAELENIRDLPPIDFSLIELDHYLNASSVYAREFSGFEGPIRAMPILTGLGCPYRCEFCINVILKRRYRFLPAEDVVREIKRLQAEYKANSFIFLDEDFFINRNRVFEFVDRVEKENLHFNWRMWCRVDHFKPGYIDRDLINRLEKIGHGSLVMGGESGDQATLDALKKGITTEQILTSLKMLRGTRIHPRYSFIVGLENESMEQIQNTYDLCFRMKEIHPGVDIAGPFVFRLYPGSPIFNRLVESYNIRIPKDLYSWSDFIRKSETTYTDMPWTPPEFQKNLKYIQFYSSHALKATARIRSFGDFLRFLLSMVAGIRVKKYFFRFPLEFLVVQQLHRIR